MKRTYLFLIIFAALAVFLPTGCGDNTDFSAEHILSADEIAEIRRQDSLKEAAKNTINADLVLKYSVEITISQSAYDGTTLTIETDKIAELFGISEAELLAGIAGESGAPEVIGFAIAGSTHADVGSSSNTNAPWGHWWDANGDVVSWGETAMVFAEFYTEDGFFTIGQYPAHLVDGQTVTFIEALKCNGKRAAVEITVTAKAREEVKATVVNTQKLTVNVTPKTDYSLAHVKFDLAKTYADLGISSMDAVSFVGVNSDGTYAQEYTTPLGFWYDMEGFVGPWGDNASVYTAYGADEGLAEDEVGIGQMPGTTAEGFSVTVKYGILYNNKIEMLEITVNIVSYEDPETPPSGTPITVEENIVITKPWDNTYTVATVDVKEILRNAFKMTTYQIHKAKTDGDLKVYIGEVTEADPSYTADVPGYWLTADGTIGYWNDDGVIWLSLGSDETELYLYGGNFPEYDSAGGVIKTKFIITCNGGKVIFNVTYNITPYSYVDPETPPSGSPETIERDVTITKTWDNTYTAASYDVKEILRNAFKMTTFQIHQAKLSGDLKVYIGEETATAPSYTADAPGYWLKANGLITNWGEESVIWLSLGSSETELYLYGGNYHDSDPAGGVINTKIIITCNGGKAIFNVSYTITPAS
jgi:hypothetical protein